MNDLDDHRSLDDLARKVAELWDREQILQCLHRYSRGVDRLDRELILSAFHDDFLDEHGKFVGTGEEFADWAIELHSRLQLSHQHCLLNHTCDIDGNTAHAETYFMFVAMNRSGRPLTIGGGRYIDRLEKRGEDWRIAARVTLRDWSDLDKIPDPADLSSMTSTAGLLSAAERAFMNAGRGPARNRTDPSYDRPLTVDPARRTSYLNLLNPQNH